MFEVGQPIFIEETGHKNGRQITVLREYAITTAGRKWIGYGFNSRFSKETMVVDGTVGWTRRAWKTREDWEAHRAHSAAWTAFRQEVSRIYSAPKHLSMDQIREMLAVLVKRPTEGEEEQ